MTSIVNYSMGNNTSRNTTNNKNIHNNYEYKHTTMTATANSAATPHTSKNAPMQPPRPPSHASHNRPPKRAQAVSSKQKPAFRQKVSTANRTAICTTTSQSVGRRTLRQLLESPSEAYSVPIFQRRYCWNQTQWDTLWHDVWKRKSLKHSLGRLTCTNALEQDQRSIIIDGQQRFTTTTLLLAATRDALLSLDDSENKHAIEALVQSIHEMLFLDPKSMEEWTAKGSSTAISEGLELEFCRLVPTFCDRSSYLAAILPPNVPQVQTFLAETYRPSWHRPLVAKKHFARHIQALLESQPRWQVLEKLTKLLLDGIDILYFPIDVHRGYEDGTEDTQVIYERLAIRDATWCKPSRKSEYLSMDGADMIRNLCLGSFQHTHSKTRFYEQYWLPLERMFQTTENDNDDDESEEESLKQVLMAFVKDPTQAFEESTTADDENAPRVIGGRIYRDFETWMARDFENWQHSPMILHHHHGGSQTGLSPSEEHTMDVGRRLLEFATRRVQSIHQ